MVQKQCFGRNITVIPNDIIEFRCVKEHVLKKASKVAQDKSGLADVAYNLINYDKTIERSIKFAFGDFIICSSP